jgi:hypothetical protein
VVGSVVVVFSSVLGSVDVAFNSVVGVSLFGIVDLLGSVSSLFSDESSDDSILPSSNDDSSSFQCKEHTGKGD